MKTYFRRPAGQAIASIVVTAGIVVLGVSFFKWRQNARDLAELEEASRREWEAGAKRFEAEKGPAAAILMAADKVEPFLIQPLHEAKGGLEGYPIVSRADVLGQGFTKRLAPILLSPKSELSALARANLGAEVTAVGSRGIVGL